MIRLDFDFDSKLKQLEESQIALKEQLENDIDRMIDIVGQPLHAPAIPTDLINWADTLFAKCLDSGDVTSIEKVCPRILKYLTVSPKLTQYLSGPTARDILFKMLESHPRERPLSNLLLHFFTNFLSIEDDVISNTKSLLLSYFKDNTPRLALTRFYINNRLYEESNRSSLINKVLSNISVDKVFSKVLPAEIRGTEFYIELLIALGGRLHSESSTEKKLFWTELNSLADRELHMICLSKYTLKSSSATDKELCKARAMKYVGDPSLYQRWQVTDKYKNRQVEINQARKKIEIWINQQFITAFFQTMQASNRGDFWLDYVKYMERVQILGSRYFLQNMKRRYPSAKQYLDKSERFKECGRASEACVFMHFADHIIILFDTENKAGICRKKDDYNLPEFKFYGNVTSIIDGGFHKAYQVNGQTIYNIKEDGRLFHIQDWKEGFKVYLNEVVI
ncbi:EH signature domain-containing protein [Saprospiraceae bacterium]|nr:EH signature domain-containing protein [Saprospiraceae bacterium]